MKPPRAFVVSLVMFAVVAFAGEPTPQPTVLESDHAEMQTVGTETRGFCEGSVTVTGTNIKLTCDRVEFVALGARDKNSTLPVLEKFKFLIATGHVRIVQGEREATCGRAELLPREDKIVLTEKPVVIDHGSELKQEGEIITMLRKERRVIVEKSRLTGPQIRDLGFDPKLPAPKGNSNAPTPTPTPPATQSNPKSEPRK